MPSKAKDADRISLAGPSFRDVLKATLEVKPPAKDEPEPKATGHVGERIKIERQKRKWSRAKLAHEAGVNVQTVRLIEEGQSSPMAETFEKLMRALGFHVDRSRRGT